MLNIMLQKLAIPLREEGRVCDFVSLPTGITCGPGNTWNPVHIPETASMPAIEYVQKAANVGIRDSITRD